MTKCIVIGEQPTESKKKPIEFVRLICVAPIRIDYAKAYPHNYKNIELISPKCYEGLDVMFAYDNTRSDGVIYLGHWNDGVAE